MWENFLNVNKCSTKHKSDATIILRLEKFRSHLLFSDSNFWRIMMTYHLQTSIIFAEFFMNSNFFAGKAAEFAELTDKYILCAAWYFLSLFHDFYVTYLRHFSRLAKFYWTTFIFWDKMHQKVSTKDNIIIDILLIQNGISK